MFLGIIPARAGFTGEPGRPPPASRDHPRSRGVYTRFWDDSRIEVGSSPLARGLRAPSDDARQGLGIIPARAGFTVRVCVRSPMWTDHPRSRGVYHRRVSAAALMTGSSPLARGLRKSSVGVTHRRGIIPARAGFTGLVLIQTTQPAGSSPLARGLLAAPPALRRERRIIPARAGFTTWTVR